MIMNGQQRSLRGRSRLLAAYAVLGLFVLLIVHLVGGAKDTKSDSIDKQATEKVATQANQVSTKQRKIKSELSKYLAKVTKDKTVSVSFYNLGATKGSTAAKSKNAAVYKAGGLATESNSRTKEISASTYKLFISAYLMHLKQQGNYSWTTANENGFYQMIVNSSNTYPESILTTYGDTTVDQFIKSQGWYSPVFQINEISATNSHSLMLLLKDMAQYKGAFSNKSDTTKILALMNKQIYRTGIPTGAKAAKKGTKVADKVGWLNDTNNDAGIVTLPNGQRYVLVIMTHGHGQSGFSGFPKIVKITKKVQEIVYE